MYKILYVDEDRSDRREFKIYCKGAFNVIDVHPPATIPELIQLIDDIKPDALVTDYQLTENDASIEYNGDDLATLYLRLRENFPVFLLTSFEDTAIDENLDPSFIYSKDVMSEVDLDKVIKFKVRVSRKIEIYKKNLADLEQQLLSLKNKKSSLTDEERATMIKLDSEIERSLGSNYSLEDRVKDDLYAAGIKSMLDKADEILKKL